jgi:hypothetical protein
MPSDNPPPTNPGGGADYYWYPEWQHNGDWTKSGDAGIGKGKYVTSDWKSFNMHTLTESDLRANPPPFTP